MQLTVCAISEADARALIEWRYPEPYAMYNWANDDPEDPEEDVHYFLNPANRFYILRDQQNSLIGFCSFGEDAQVPGGDYSLDALDVGLGMAPNWVGQGLGNSFLATILTFAQQNFSPVALRTTIAEFNQRSRRIFANAGFTQVQRFLRPGNPPVEFLVLIKEV